jgi:hypothetical protein
MSIGDSNTKLHPFYSDGESVNLFSTKSKKMLKSQNRLEIETTRFKFSKGQED